MNRRDFVAALPAVAFVSRLPAHHAGRMQRVFLGSTGKQSQGIVCAQFDAATGTLTTPVPVSSLPGNDSMALHPKRRNRLYTTGAVDGAAVVQGYDIGSGQQPLRPINQQPTRGAGANFLSIDPSGNVAMEANWGTGDVSTYHIAADGALSAIADHIAYGDANHGPQPVQAHSRCHSILTAPGGKFVLVNDYGCDRIYIYRLDTQTAKLTPHTPTFFAAQPGSAPRHLVLHPNGRWIYCNYELTNTIDLLDWDARRGTLTLRERVSTLPLDAPPKCRTADMVLSADRRFLYCSVRTLESFVTYAVQPDGSLRRLQFLQSKGAENRCIALDATGRWLLAANPRSGDVCVLPRDAATGLLDQQVSSVTVPGACFVLWA